MVEPEEILTSCKNMNTIANTFEFLRLPEDLQRHIFYRMHVFDRIKLARLVLPRNYADEVLYKRGTALDDTDAGINEDIYLAILIRSIRSSSEDDAGFRVDVDALFKFVISRAHPRDPTLSEMRSRYSKEVDTWSGFGSDSERSQEKDDGDGHHQKAYWRMQRLICALQTDVKYEPASEDIRTIFDFFMDVEDQMGYERLLKFVASMKPLSFIAFAHQIQNAYDESSTNPFFNASSKREIEWTAEDLLYVWIVSSKNECLLRFLHENNSSSSLPPLFRLERIRRRMMHDDRCLSIQRLAGDEKAINLFFEFNPDTPMRARRSLLKRCLVDDPPMKMKASHTHTSGINTSVLVAKYLCTIKTKFVLNS